jgi:hypothetical protein
LKSFIRKSITLKAFANSSPGLRFGNPGKRRLIHRTRNSEGVASAFVNREAAQPLQGCEQFPRALLDPGFQSKPWADIGQRLQRYSIDFRLFAHSHLKLYFLWVTLRLALRDLRFSLFF